jgi:hypothetical protein
VIRDSNHGCGPFEYRGHSAEIPCDEKKRGRFRISLFFVSFCFSEVSVLFEFYLMPWSSPPQTGVSELQKVKVIKFSEVRQKKTKLRESYPLPLRDDTGVFS